MPVPRPSLLEALLPSGQPWAPRKRGDQGTGEDVAGRWRVSRGGVGDLLYPAHFLVGSCHVAVDEATQLGPGSLRLGWEVVGKFLGDHLQNDSREDLGAKGGREVNAWVTCPPRSPWRPFFLVWVVVYSPIAGSLGARRPKTRPGILLPLPVTAHWG